VNFPNFLRHAIPNSGRRACGTAVKLKKDRVRPGVPDLFLPAAIGGFHGLYVEMTNAMRPPSDL
jgi:hypothetical protein